MSNFLAFQYALDVQPEFHSNIGKMFDICSGLGNQEFWDL